MSLPLNSFCRAAAYVALAMLTACGGGGSDGGGGGGGGGGGTAPTLTADYAPLNTGDRRLFRVTAGVDVGSIVTETIGAQAQLGAYAAFELRDETGELSYLARTPTALVAIPGAQSGALALALGPLDMLRFGLGVGDSAQLFERGVSVDVDGDGRTDNVTLRADFTVVGFEALTLPVGTFSSTARTRTVLRSSISFGSGGSASLTLTTEEWFAAGVGLVRSTTTTQVAGQTATTDNSDLQAYGVGSVRSETVAPQVQSVTPANGSAGAAPDVLRVRFSERVDRSTLLATGAVRLLDAAGNNVAVAVDVLDVDGATEATVRPNSMLQQGRYTLRLAGTVVDWANNALAATDSTFTVDTQGPRLTASSPAADSLDAAWTGSVVLVFDEPVQAVDAAGVFIEVLDATGQSPAQRLPASITGSTVQATLATPLPRDRAHELRLVGNLRDAAGNVLQASSLRVAFTTDPGPLARPTALAAGAGVSALRLLDFTQDGRADVLLVADDTATGQPFLGLRAGQAAGGLGPLQRLLGLGGAGSCTSQQLVAGDFDGDGRMDVAVACASFLRVYLQTAPGVFTLERPGFNGSSGFGVGDFNGDGRADLALVGTPPGVDIGQLKSWQIITRASNGVWTALPPPADAGDLGPLAPLVADVDNDGRPDLVWLRAFFDGRIDLAWARGQATGLAATQSQTLAVEGLGGAWDMAVGDVNGDGRSDVLLTLYGSRRLLVLRGQAGGGFALSQGLPSGLAPYGVTLGDVDGDGRPDAIVNHGSERLVGVYLQAADGSLQPERLFTTGGVQLMDGRSLAVLDVDGDGRRDLVAAGDVLLARPFSQAWPSGVGGVGGGGATTPGLQRGASKLTVATRSPRLQSQLPGAGAAFDSRP